MRHCLENGEQEQQCLSLNKCACACVCMCMCTLATCRHTHPNSTEAKQLCTLRLLTQSSTGTDKRCVPSPSPRSPHTALLTPLLGSTSILST